MRLQQTNRTITHSDRRCALEPHKLSSRIRDLARNYTPGAIPTEGTNKVAKAKQQSPTRRKKNRNPQLEGRWKDFANSQNLASAEESKSRVFLAGFRTRRFKFPGLFPDKSTKNPNPPAWREQGNRSPRHLREPKTRDEPPAR